MELGVGTEVDVAVVLLVPVVVHVVAGTTLSRGEVAKHPAEMVRQDPPPPGDRPWQKVVGPTSVTTVLVVVEEKVVVHVVAGTTLSMGEVA